MKKFISIITLIGMVVFIYIAQKIVMPKYLENKEGRLIEEYYKEKMGHDLIFVGDCEVYETFSPKILWEEYGINSYIRGSAAQYIGHSYYLLKEMLRRESPRAVVFNVLAVKYESPQKESYNRMTLDGMKLSLDKISAFYSGRLKKEQLIEYIFPILRFHSRWKELDRNDFSFAFEDLTVSHNGYLMNVNIKKLTTLPKPKPLPDYKINETARYYLDKMRELCSEKGVELILIKAPILYPHWYDEWDSEIKEYADKNGLRYINFLELQDETEIDYSKDTYDGGLHLNIYGAEKMSMFLGKILRDELGFVNRHGEKDLEKIWKKKIEWYEEEKRELLKKQTVEN